MKFLFTLLFLISNVFGIVYAQPNQQPLVVVVPFPPGGDTDILARLFATEYTAKTGRTTVVDNRPGAAGIIGFNYLTKVNPNGNTIGLVPSTLATAPYFSSAAKYDPVKDFTPIMQLIGHGMFIAVSSNTGIKNIPELIDAIKSGRITTYGTPGVASPQNIFGEMFKKETKTEMVHIPFRGNADVINNLLSGTIQLTFNTALPLLPQVEAGKVTILAIAGSKRSAMFPTVPSLEEYNLKGLDFESWLGFVGPKDMDPSVVQELNAAFNDIIKQPQVQERLRKLAMMPVGSSPNVFRNRILKDSEKFSRVSKDIDIRAE